MTRSFMRLQQVDPGFKPERVVTALLSLPVTKYPEGPQVVDFYHQLEERVARCPVSSPLRSPVTFRLQAWPYLAFFVDGRPIPRPDEYQPDTVFIRASRDYFA